MDRRTVVVCPRGGSDPPQVDIPRPKRRRWGAGPHRREGGVRWDGPGQRRGPLPSAVWTRHGGSETGTVWGLRGHNIPRKRKGGVGGVRIGQAGGGRARGGERPMGVAACGGRGFKGRTRVSGERPIGAARCRQQRNRAACQPPPPPPKLGRRGRRAGTGRLRVSGLRLRVNERRLSTNMAVLRQLWWQPSFLRHPMPCSVPDIPPTGTPDARAVPPAFRQRAGAPPSRAPGGRVRIPARRAGRARVARGGRVLTSGGRLLRASWHSAAEAPTDSRLRVPQGDEQQPSEPGPRLEEGVPCRAEPLVVWHRQRRARAAPRKHEGVVWAGPRGWRGGPRRA